MLSLWRKFKHYFEICSHFKIEFIVSYKLFNILSELFLTQFYAIYSIKNMVMSWCVRFLVVTKEIVFYGIHVLYI